MRRHHLAPGRLDVPHRFGAFGVQSEACRRGIAFTGHPMIGHDIIDTHPMNSGAAVGRTAERDFLTYANAIRRLQGLLIKALPIRACSQCITGVHGWGEAGSPMISPSENTRA